MEFKISPLILFIGIFILLALSVYFGKSGAFNVGPSSSHLESYITLEYATPVLTKVTLNRYSPTSSQVYKLFDNIFFDRTNANTIELVGYQQELGGNTDVSGYRIYTSDGFTNNYQLSASGQVVTESTISAIPTTYSNFIVTSQIASTTPSKQVAVVTWKKNTFITVFNYGNLNAKPAPSPTVGFMAYFPESVTASVQSRFFDINNTNGTTPTSQYPIGLRDAGSNSVSDLSDGKSLALTNYDSTKQVYQVCKGVMYDTKNSSIITVNADATIVVYTRPTSLGVNPTGATYPDTSNQPAKNTPTSVPNVSYAPWYFITPDNKYLVQYIAWGQNTIVTVFVNRLGVLVVLYTYRFNSDGTIDGANVVIQPSTSTNTSTSTRTSGNTSTTGTNDISNYYQWLAFWNTVANSPSTANLSASNLVPKSSIVPPVCPSCPSCNISGNTVCTNCGGQGGSGTQGASGSNTGSSGSDTGSKVINVLEDAGSGTTSLLRDAGSGTVQFAKDTASGTAQFAKDTASGTAQFAKDTASGTVGLAKDTVSGTVGLAKDTASGVANLFGVKNPTQVQGAAGPNAAGPGAAGPGAAGQIPGVDPYSYFGAIPPKGANYIPVTASFSAFSK